MAYYIKPRQKPRRIRKITPALIPAYVEPGSYRSNGGSGSAFFTGIDGEYVAGGVFDALAGNAVFTGFGGFIEIGGAIGFDGAPAVAQATGYPGSTDLTSGATPVGYVGDAFDPSLSELGVDIWERLDIALGSLTPTHFASMRRSMNFVLSRWANKGIDLWKVNQTAIQMVAGREAYTLAPDVIDVLDTYISRMYGGVTTDIVMSPISRNVWAAQSQKSTVGMPTQFWVDRQRTPVLHVWPVPDFSGLYTLKYFAFRQITRVDPTMGLTSTLPYRFIEPYTAAVAAHLAQKWRKDAMPMLKALSDELWDEAASNDVEKVDWTITPDFSAYF